MNIILVTVVDRDVLGCVQVSKAKMTPSEVASHSGMLYAIVTCLHASPSTKKLRSGMTVSR